IPAERVVAVGVREIDDGEHEPLRRLTHLTVGDLDRPEAVADAVVATGASRAWVHVDVDVLDPAEIGGVSAPAPFGTSANALADALRALRDRIPLAGATIAGFAPRAPSDAVNDLGALLRIIGAVA